MHIPSYKIQNVLKVYSRQVSQGKILSRSKNGQKIISKDSVSISSEGKRRAIIDKVTDDIVDKIITEGSSQSSEVENDNFYGSMAQRQAQAAYMKNHKSLKAPKEFTYTSIDEKNNKTSHTLSVADAQFISSQAQIDNPIVPENIGS